MHYGLPKCLPFRTMTPQKLYLRRWGEKRHRGPLGHGLPRQDQTRELLRQRLRRKIATKLLHTSFLLPTVFCLLIKRHPLIMHNSLPGPPDVFSFSKVKHIPGSSAVQGVVFRHGWLGPRGLGARGLGARGWVHGTRVLGIANSTNPPKTDLITQLRDPAIRASPSPHTTHPTHTPTQDR